MKKTTTTQTNFAGIALLSVLCILLLIGIVAGTLMLTDNSKYTISEKKNNPLNKVINENLEGYRTVVSNDLYCPYTIGQDIDKDNVDDFCDNCPLHYNPEQFDNDRDGVGNDCDSTPNGVSKSDAPTVPDTPTMPVTCSNNADCGTDGFIGGFFCSSNNVAINYQIFTCNNAGTTQSSCSVRTEDRVINTCTNGCSNGQCNDQPPQCTNKCTDGARQCSGNGFQVCRDYDGNGCTEWSSTAQCGFGQTCNNGNCDSQPQCTPQNEVCDGRDNDCDGQTDEGGVCQPTCTNKCTDGARQCSGNGFQVCRDYDGNGCTEWSSTAQCGFGKTCSAGQCN